MRKTLYYIISFLLMSMMVWGFYIFPYVIIPALGEWSLLPIGVFHILGSIFGGTFFMYKAVDAPSYEERKAKSRKENGL